MNTKTFKMETSGKTLPKKNLPTMASTDAEVSPFIGNAATVIFLLRNYDTFGLAERVRKNQMFER